MHDDRPLLSIVVPDAFIYCAPLLQKSLLEIQKNTQVEVIFIAKEEAMTRAERLNKGFFQTKAQIILFHHPRSWLSADAFSLLLKLSQNKPIWGGFTHQFDISHPLLKFTSWYSNFIRGRRGILYLDHCIYFHRSLWTQDILPVAIFEDTILSKNFLKQMPPIIQKPISYTSAIRFVKNGIWRQAVMNQFLKVAFYFKLPQDKMNTIYEKGLGLNDPKK
ncbi:MAG: hypothetical protein ABL930_04875 [Pseudobdellovibrio sp.]